MNKLAMLRIARTRWDIDRARTPRLLLFLLLLATLPMGCGDGEPFESFARRSGALTPEQQSVLGFEQASLWSSPQTSLSTSDTRVEGEHSVAVPANGWTEVTSVPIGSLEEVGETFSYQLRLASAPAWGETRAIMTLPSQQIYSLDIGGISLTSLPAGSFQTVQFSLSPALIQALEAQYEDLQLRIVINGPPLSEPYLLDNASFGTSPTTSTTSTTSAGGAAGSGAASTTASTTSDGDSTGTGGAGGSTTSGADTSASDGSSTGGVGGAMAAEQYTISFDLPPLLSSSEVATLAKEDLELRDRAEVTGAVGSLPATVSMGEGGMVIGNQALPKALYSRGPVSLGHQTIVGGSIFTTTPVSGLENATVQGSVVTNFQFDPPGQLSWSVEVPSVGNGDVMLAPEMHIPLGSGRWGQVSVMPRSSITLTAGDHFFDSLQVLEPEGEIRIDDSAGPVRLYVLGSVIFRGAIVDLNGAATPELFMVALGNELITMESAFRSFLFAPNATVQLRESHEQAHAGSIFANRIIFDAGAVFEHVPLPLDKFFPTSLGLDPFQERTRETIVGQTQAGEPIRECDPGLKLEYTLDGIQAETDLDFRTVEESETGCIDEYLECDPGAGLGTAHTVSLAELNAVPDPDDVCDGAAEIFPCGVDPESVVWDDEFGLCQSDADCLLFGKVCAKVCLQPNCTGSADCIDPTCNIVEQRCATPIASCEAMPTDAQCETRTECPDPDASGSSNPNEHQLTGVPASNLDAPPQEMPPSAEVPDNRPTQYLDQHDGYCADPPAQVMLDVQPEPDEREIGVGNDRWGFFGNADIEFNANSRALPLGGQATVNALGRAFVDLNVRVWDRDVSVFRAGGLTRFETCGGEITRELKLFGFDIDPGFEDPLPEVSNNPLCDTLAALRVSKVTTLRDMMFRAIQAKELTECLGPVGDGNGVNASRHQSFCENSLQPLQEFGNLLDNFEAPTSCATPADWQAIPGKWVELYKAHRDLVASDIAQLNDLQLDFVSGLPTLETPFLDREQSFTAYKVVIYYPIGPVLIIIEVELAGFWGVHGAMENQFGIQPVQVKTHATLKPSFGVTALVFAGVGVGPVSVGVGGELLLAELQLPMTAGVTISQSTPPEGDTRPRPFPELPYAFEQAIAGIPSFPPFGPSWSDWNSDWDFGAAARTNFLNGNISLQARIRMLFYKKTFRKTLADWQGFSNDYSLVGQLLGQDDDGQVLVAPSNGFSRPGWAFEEVSYVDPDALAAAQVREAPPEVDPAACSSPRIGPCEIIE